MPDMPEVFNPIDASWLPVLRSSGAVERVPPWRVSDRIRASGIAMPDRSGA